MNARINRWLGLVVLLVATGAWPTRGQTPQPQTITWTGTTNQLLRPDVAYLFGATASSGLPVEVRVVGGPANYAGGTVTVTGEGTVWVEAKQDGNSSYSPARQRRAFNYKQAFLLPKGALSAGSGFGVSKVRVFGRYACLQTGFDGSAYSLGVVDLMDLALPKEVARFRIKWYPASIGLLGTKILANDLDGGMHVLDFAGPSQVVDVESERYRGLAYDMAVVDHYAYLVTSPDPEFYWGQPTQPYPFDLGLLVLT